MPGLSGKKIILAITGSIAAYKAASLARLFIKSDAEVQVLMTEAAKAFITPLTLSTLSKKPVYSEIISDDGWNNHVEFGLWADAMVIAPCTANTLAKMANGLCDNIVLASYLSARCPIFFAPAMDLDMWTHPATVQNLKKLQNFGCKLIPVGHGELASGLVGDGRMAEPEAILEMLAQELTPNSLFSGKKVLITAGPTYEAIDPVRFIGNRSSGKMGIVLADCLASKGAKVKLVLGPSHLQTNHGNIETIRVESAQEMYEAALNIYPEVEIAIMAAAVADYRPKVVAAQKIKKKSDTFELMLEKTKDIAASLGKIKRKDQINVGFALETANETANAAGKLGKKNFDFVVLNSLNDKGAGFNKPTNKISILSGKDKIKKFELKPKEEVAIDIVQEIENLLVARSV